MPNAIIKSGNDDAFIRRNMTYRHEGTQTIARRWPVCALIATTAHDAMMFVPQGAMTLRSQRDMTRVQEHEDALTMTRKPTPPISYGDDVALPGVGAPEPSARPPAAPEALPDEAPEQGRGGRRPILDKSAPTLVYVHPSGKHQLRQYAVAQGLKVKVHDLLLEALEEWGEKRGLVGPWRVPPSKPRR